MAKINIPDEWQNSVLLPVFTGKGDTMDCGSYRAVKLMECEMKVTECAFEGEGSS